MVAEFDSFATRMTAPLTGLAQLLTGDPQAAGTLVHTALTRAYSERVPDERRVVASLVRAWLAGPPPVEELDGELPYDLELLRRSLDALPEGQRVVVVLHHWSGLTAPEIATMLRRPEPAVAADLAAGVAELHVPAPAEPDEPPPTVDARLAALVAAAGPPLVDLARVVEAGQRQRRHRRRTAVAAVGVLIAAATAATLLTAGEPEPASSKKTPVRVVATFSGSTEVVVDDRARRLTAQFAAAMDDVLPGVTDPPEFSVYPPGTYTAKVDLDTTQLFFFVHDERATEGLPPCADPAMDCTSRQFPDGTVAEVVVHPSTEVPGLDLLARRPDGTVLAVITVNSGMPGPPELTVETLFRFATVVTY